jgi:hypothetical protein
LTFLFAGALNGRNTIVSHGVNSFPANHNRRKSLEVVGKVDTSKSDNSSSGASPYLVSSKVKKRFPNDNSSRDIRPITSKLDRPSNASLDLPNIHVPTQQMTRHQFHHHHTHHNQQQQQQQQPQTPHLITNKLSRQMKLRGRMRRSSSITSLNESMTKNNNNNNDDEGLLKKVISRPATTTSRTLQTGKSRVELSKPEKVPEPCRSCGRNDLPERFHTHGPNTDHTGKHLI